MRTNGTYIAAATGRKNTAAIDGRTIQGHHPDDDAGKKGNNHKTDLTWHASNIPAEKNGSPSMADKHDGHRSGQSSAFMDRDAKSIPAGIPS